MDVIAHAIVVNDETSAVLNLSDLEYMYFGEKTFPVGDVNGDGKVNIANVNCLVNIILGGEDLYEGRADVNGDNEVNIADINAVIDVILSN